MIRHISIGFLFVAFIACKKQEIKPKPTESEPAVSKIDRNDRIVRGEVFFDNLGFGRIRNRIIELQTNESTEDNPEVIFSTEADENGAFYYRYNKKYDGTKAKLLLKNNDGTPGYHVFVDGLELQGEIVDSFYLERFGKLQIHLSADTQIDPRSYIYFSKSGNEGFLVQKYRGQFLKEYVVPLDRAYKPFCKGVGVTYWIGNESSREEQELLETCIFPLPAKSEFHL